MKKTENISLEGYSFTIEEDAYIELKDYINDIQEAFSTDASGDEIVADIEERIAELMREQSTGGKVIDLRIVNDIKGRIGNPKELAQSDEESPSAAEPETNTQDDTKKTFRNRHMFRNIDERVIGGVCSGLGIYFNIDKVLFRIIFLVLMLIGFAEDSFFMIPVLAYICLWIAMPAARTAEQKREMKGRPTRLDNYRSRDFDLKREVKDVSQSPAGQTVKRAGGVFLGIIMLITGLSGMLTCIIVPSMSDLIYRIMDGCMVTKDLYFNDIITNMDTTLLIFAVMCAILCVWFIYNGVMLIFDLTYPKWRPGLVLFISWIISIFVLLAYLIRLGVSVIPPYFI